MASSHSCSSPIRILAFECRQQQQLLLLRHSTRNSAGSSSSEGMPAKRTGQRFRRAKCHRTGKSSLRSVKVYANGGGDFSSSEMPLENALQLLGIREGATFDEILQAKNALIDTSGGDQDRILQVEAAYDALLMQRLMKRRAGEVVDSSVLYADVRKRKARSTSSFGWLRGAFKNLPVNLATPASSTLATQTAVYGVLMALTYASGLTTEAGDGATAADATGVTLAVGFGASLYFLRQQNVNLGKAAAITTAGLVAGAMMGNVVESWLRVDLVPVAGISSSSVMVSEFVLLWLWLVALYLR